MSETLNLALQLLLVGMISVFVILGIVVGLGKLLILIVNNFTPDILEKPSTRIVSTEKQEVAVLSAVVEIVTRGHGKIKSIKKI